MRLNSGFIAQAAPEQIERDILKSSYTPEVNLAGIKVANMTGVSEMFGDDYTDGVTKPEFNDLFRTAGLNHTKIEGIPLSGITTNFVYDEIVSGATGVGRVVVPTELTDTVLYVEVTTPGFAAESLTGSIAGDATATGAEVDAGWAYKFDTDLCVRGSAQAEEDLSISQMYNCVPTLNITCDAGGIPLMNYEISGVIYDLAGVAQWLRDGVMTDITGFRSEVIPPLFTDARLVYDNGTVNWSPVVDGTMTIDTSIERNLRIDANSELGAEGYVLTGRNPTSTYRVNTPTNVEADIMKDWFDATGVATQFRFGQDVGNTFWFFTPAARLQNVTPADENGEMKQELEFSLTGQDDQELEIVCI
jgi:hypothetical protein